jgi:hypothetical protein
MHTISTVLRKLRVHRRNGCHVNYGEVIIGKVVDEVEVNDIFGFGAKLGHQTNSVSWGGAVGFVTVDNGVLISVNGGGSAGGAAGVCTWGCSR